MICNNDLLASIASYVQAKVLDAIFNQHRVGNFRTTSIAKHANRDLAVAAGAPLVQDDLACTSSESLIEASKYDSK